jgi:pyruvate/2-oxoglutarate/acetoin dehydrogenase E1 component
VPGLKVVFASTPSDVRGLLWSSIYDDNTGALLRAPDALPDQGGRAEELEPIPLGQARVHREGEDVTVIATGRLVHEALARPRRRRRKASRSRSSTRATLQPLDEDARRLVKKTNRCVVAHEAVVRGGFGAEVAAVIQYQGVRLAGRADRARRLEVHADPVRAR